MPARAPFCTTRPSPRLLLIAAVVCWPGARLAAQPITGSTWTGASGNWTNPALWSTNPFYPNNGNPPGTLYNASLNGSGTVAVDAPITVQFFSANVGGGFTLAGSGPLNVVGATSLNQGGGDFNVPTSTGSLNLQNAALGGSAPIQVGGSMTWNEGTIQGSGPVTAAGGLSLTGTGPKTLNGRSLTLAGGTGNLDDGAFNFFNGAVFTIGSGTTFSTRRNNGWVYIGGAAPTLAVNGTLAIGSLAMVNGPVANQIIFTNVGTVDLQFGNQTANGGLTNTGRVHTAAGT